MRGFNSCHRKKKVGCFCSLIALLLQTRLHWEDWWICYRFRGAHVYRFCPHEPICLFPFWCNHTNQRLVKNLSKTEFYLFICVGKIISSNSKENFISIRCSTSLFFFHQQWVSITSHFFSLYPVRQKQKWIKKTLSNSVDLLLYFFLIFIIHWTLHWFYLIFYSKRIVNKFDVKPTWLLQMDQLSSSYKNQQ